MASLIDIVQDPDKRRAIVTDAAQLLDLEVSEKRGFSGKAVKLAFRAVKGVTPQMIPMSIDALIDDFAEQIQPFWAECETSGSDARSFFTARSSKVAEALLSITDERAQRSSQRVLKGAYSKLRGQAVQHITASMPRLADLIERHAS
jgi:hypothetical protein